MRGWFFFTDRQAAEAVDTITSGLTTERSIGATAFIPARSSDLARAYADLGRFDDAWRSIDEAMTAMKATKERWWEAEINRIAGEIVLKSHERDGAKAKLFRARTRYRASTASKILGTARGNEHGAALARSRQAGEARDLLAPVYGWFTEGFDTLDLKEAKALLDALHA